jgi:hypothetical protein
MGGVCPNAQENGEIRLSDAIRAGRGADGGPHLVSVLREGRKSANTRSSSGVIRGIPGKTTRLVFQLPVPPIEDQLAPFPQLAHRMKPYGANRIFSLPSLDHRSGDLPRSGENSADRSRPEYGRNEPHSPVQYPGPTPHDFLTHLSKCLLHEFAHRSSLAGRKDIIVGFRLLRDQPHSFHIVASVTPIPLGIEITEKKVSWTPSSIAATARVILRETKVSPRVGTS